MGLKDRQREMYENTAAAMSTLLAPGEDLLGIVFANNQKTFSMALYVVGTTTQRLILQPVDRKWQPNGDPISVRRGELTDSSVWGWARDDASMATKVKTFIGTNGQELRFQANGQKWKFMTLGGNLLENMMAADEQLSGLNALIDFLRATN